MTAISTYEYCIVGAGPGGLQLAYYLQKKGFDYVVLEASGAPGAFFSRFPRHRRLISINKTHTGIDDPDTNLRWDWNSLLCDDPELRFTRLTPEYFPSADVMVAYLQQFAEKFQLNVRYGWKVETIERDGDGFVVNSAAGTIRAAKLIVATGRIPRPLPDIPGIEHAETYADMPTDPQQFAGQRVLILGKGNSAMETAENLMETAAVIHLLSPSPVRLAWRTHYVGDVRAVNNNVLDTYQLKSQNTILDATLERIDRLNCGAFRAQFLYTHAEGERRAVTVDRILACIGFMWDPTVFAQMDEPPRASPCGRFPALTSAFESVNVKGLYFAGALQHVLDYRKSFSGFIHGFRYNAALLADILDRRAGGAVPAPQSLPNSWDGVLDAAMERVNTASSLFQQPGFLADIFAPGPNGDCLHYRDLTVDLFEDEVFAPGKPYLAVTMEYGDVGAHADPFNIHRFPTDGRRSAFIHPVMRLRRDGEIVAEHHIPEDLENQWRLPEQLDQAREFLGGLDAWRT
ncbi:NAD(P)-binding domain-containing protein [Methylocystis echinoides]|uniref:Pyridine nucleotide-disulfide oxidoreductase n=1 Tax=Methylocystis echinoides TaxID=29468 RepID=A0A9W6LTA9_9HYPH|nr:NAD(P)-binding domain-containing protein [Methylocystis echinoides]GLI94550.1 pyridine nucleotide-disulfide oxidoreductase [Methylocystis echinoides]